MMLIQLLAARHIAINIAVNIAKKYCLKYCQKHCQPCVKKIALKIALKYVRICAVVNVMFVINLRLMSLVYVVMMISQVHVSLDV